jgi:hypothetical protein
VERQAFGFSVEYVPPPPRLKTETDPVSETFCFLFVEIRTMDKVQKVISNDCSRLHGILPHQTGLFSFHSPPSCWKNFHAGACIEFFFSYSHYFDTPITGSSLRCCPLCFNWFRVCSNRFAISAGICMSDLFMV